MTKYTPNEDGLMTRAQIGQALECAYIEASELEEVIDNILVMLSKTRAEAKAEALEEMAKMIGSKAKILDPEDPIQKGARIGLITASVDLSARANQYKEASK